MEEPKKNSESSKMMEKCNEYCLHGMGHKHYVLRLVLGVIILVAVYSLGVQVGEFRASFGGNYGYGRHSYMMGGFGGQYPTMMGGGYYGGQYAPMMGGWYAAPTQQQSATSAPAPTKK